MGLDTSHGCWHGSYIAFTRWRNGIAAAAGYAIWPLNGEYGPRDTVMLDWGHLGTPEHLAGLWKETPSDPLVVLIVHSDCEGHIYPAQAGPLADRLESLLPLLPAERDLGHIGDWREKTQKFIDGLRLAAAAGEPVAFH